MSFSAEVSDDALQLHYDSIAIDGVSFFCEGHNDYLKRGGLTAFLATVPWVDDDEAGAIRRISDYHQLIQNDPKLSLIEKASDIDRAKENGTVGIIITFQNARPLNYGPMMAEMFYRLGTRVVQLTYNDRNFAGDGAATGADGGLSREGRALIREMNRVGMVLDLSHAAERTCLDAIEATEDIPILSHANPRAIADVPRNVGDEQIKQIAARGGVIGLCPFPPMNWRGGEQWPTFDDYLDCIDYVVDLVGIDHVGIGSDKEATPGAYPREPRMRLGARFASALGGFTDTFFKGGELRYSLYADLDKGAGHFLKGFQNIGDWPVITQGLLNRGYKADDIRKILGANFKRVFASVWK